MYFQMKDYGPSEEDDNHHNITPVGSDYSLDPYKTLVTK